MATPPGPKKIRGDESDGEIAQRLNGVVTNANSRVKPLLSAMSRHFTKAERLSDKASDNINNLDEEAALVSAVKPLLEEASAILRETPGAVRALDPDGAVANRAQGRAHWQHAASREEQQLAEALAALTGDTVKAVDEAKDKVAGMPKAKKELGPLFAAVTDPLFQIVSGVGLLLNGVPTLVSNILDGLGLGGVVRGIADGLGINKLLKGVGLRVS